MTVKKNKRYAIICRRTKMFIRDSKKGYYFTESERAATKWKSMERAQKKLTEFYFELDRSGFKSLASELRLYIII